MQYKPFKHGRRRVQSYRGKRGGKRRQRGGIAWGKRGKEKNWNSCRRIFGPGVKLFKPGPHGTGLQSRAPVIDETRHGGDPPRRIDYMESRRYWLGGTPTIT